MPNVTEINFETGKVTERDYTAEELTAIAQMRADNPDPAPRWDPLQFLERFTQAERIAIRQAAAGTSPEALQLADWLDLLRVAPSVVADDPRTVQGMLALVDAGLISAGRRDEILGGA